VPANGAITPGGAATIAAVVDTFVPAIEAELIQLGIVADGGQFARRSYVGPTVRFNF